LQSVETGLQAPNASLTAWNTPTGSTYAQDGSARPKDAPTAIRPTSSTADDDPYRSLRPLSATPTPIMTSPTSILQEDTLRVPPKRQVDQTTQTSIPTTPTTTPGKRPLPIPPSRSTSLASPTSTHTLEAGLGPATSTGTLAPSHDHSTHDHSTRDHSTTGLPLSDAMTLSQAARHSLHVIEPSAGLAVPRAPPEFYPPGPPSHAPESSEGFVPERSTSTTPDIKLPSNTLGTLPPHGTSGHASAYTQRPLPSPPNASVHSRLSGLSGTGSYSHDAHHARDPHPRAQPDQCPARFQHVRPPAADRVAPALDARGVAHASFGDYAGLIRAHAPTGQGESRLGEHAHGYGEYHTGEGRWVLAWAEWLWIET
jgi:hypothetical protein